MNTQDFSELSYKKQYQALMAATSLRDLQNIAQISKPTLNNISSWMVHWFQSFIIENQKISASKIKYAIEFQRKFKPLLNETFANELSPYLLTLNGKPDITQTSETIVTIFYQWLFSGCSQGKVHIFCCPLSNEELRYLLYLEEDSDLKPEEIKSINNLLHSFSSQHLDFKLLEAILLLAGTEEGNPLFIRLLAYPEDKRKNYLMNLQTICGLGIHSSLKQDDIRQHLFSLKEEQRDDVILHLCSHFQGMKSQLKSDYLAALFLLPGISPSLAFPALKQVLDCFVSHDNHYEIEHWLNSFKAIPEELRSHVLLTIATYLPKNMKACKISSLFKLLGNLPKDRIDSTAHNMVLFISRFSSFNDGLQIRMSTIDPKLEILECLEPIFYLFKYEENYENTFNDFFYLIAKLPTSDIKQIIASLLPFKDKITSDRHFTAIVKTLMVFDFKDFSEVLPFLIGLDQNTLHKHLSVALKAFPQDLRKGILVRMSPYFSSFSIDPQFSDFVMTVGLSSYGENSTTSMSAQISGKNAPPRAPLITLEKLKQEKLSCSLVEYIAGYLGDKNNLISLSAATQWIQHSAMHVFSDSALFLRELAANAFDSQLPWEKQIGNFGMGFYSIFALFQQPQHPIDRIEITASYHEDSLSDTYKMIFYKDAFDTLQISWEYMESKGQGTSIQIYPKQGTSFSNDFLQHLESTLQDFRYFQHGFIEVNGNDNLIGNKDSNLFIKTTLKPSVICVSDRGCGIPLSKIHLLLIPSISNKRRAPVAENKNLALPNIRKVPCSKVYSSLIFTINSVVNSTYSLDRKFFDKADENCDLLIEMDKSFKPNLSRDSIIIPGRKSPQAKALRKMIENCIQDAFSKNNNNSTLLLMLSKGLQKWECHGVPADLQGHFSGHFQSILRRELAKSGSLPCHDHPWIIHFKNTFFKEGGKYVPLPEELVPEGYTRFELDLIKKFELMLPGDRFQVLRELGIKRQMIEGLSVIFLHDSWLFGENKNAVVSSGPCSSILFAPYSLLNEEPTFEAVQRKVCQRYVNKGKRIKPAVPEQPAPLFSSALYFPGRAFQLPQQHFISLRAKNLFTNYSEKVELYLKSPFIQSLDKDTCIQLFWHCFPKLTKSVTVTDWDFDGNRGKTPYASHRVILENADREDAFGCNHTYEVNWEVWFKQTLIVDPASKCIYKIQAGADLTEISQQMTEMHQREDYYKTGESILPLLLEKYSPLFETVEDEPFKRLCVLMLVQWGIDPYQQDNLYYFENGIHKHISLELIEKGIENFLIPPEDLGAQSRCIFYGGPHIDFSNCQRSQDLDRFAPLLLNLKPFLSSDIEFSLIQNLMDLHVLKQETPAYCASYADQLFELYYRYLTIPSEKFPYRYGSGYHLSTLIEEGGYHLHQAIHLLRQLPQKTGIKLLQQLMGKLTEKLKIERRDYNLQRERLEIPALRGANILGILSLGFSDSKSNVPLLTSIMSLSATYEETVSLALIAYFAKKFVPAFFKLPLEYQESSLKIILGTILRSDNPDKINSILYHGMTFYHRTLGNYDKSDLTSSIKAGIDCVELFAARYQNASLSNPLLFQNPMHLLQQADLSVFHFPGFMETLFNNPNVSEVLAHNDINEFVQLMQSTSNTGRFTDFGMITHSSAHGQSYNAWQLPLIELLRNSISMTNKGVIMANYALLPCDAEYSQLAYEISDTMGFADLESLLSLLIPGYHPHDSQQAGSGFFNMLPEVSLLYYRTRLQKENSQIISLIVQPVRDQKNDIVDLKIGLKRENSDETFSGTVCRVYMNKQKNIEALMHLRRTHHFTTEILVKARFDKSKEIKIFLNGDDTHLLYTDNWDVAQIETPFPALFGSCTSTRTDKPGCVLIDGFPHHSPLNAMLEQAGFSFYNLFKDEFISLPKEFFVPMHDPNKLIIKKEFRPVIAKFLVDWIYFHLFEGDRCTAYLEHYESRGPMDQLISLPEKIVGTPEQMLLNLNKESDYYRIFSQYSYSVEVISHGVKQKIRIPSFAEYLWQVYQEVYPKWIEEKRSKEGHISYDLFQKWRESKKSVFAELGNDSLIKVNNELLEHVEKWVRPKFQYLEWNNLDTGQVDNRSKSNESAPSPITHFALLEKAEPKWVQAKSLTEEVLNFYVTQTMLSQAVENPHVSVVLEELTNSKAGRYRKKEHSISIGLKCHHLSRLLSLVLALAKKETDSHYMGDLIYSEIPYIAGTLNHEIYHALKHAKGEKDEGHKHHEGISFEIGARNMADLARSKGVLTALENKILEILQKYNWTFDTLSELIKEAKELEAKM